jgi:hypothetical protein
MIGKVTLFSLALCAVAAFIGLGVLFTMIYAMPLSLKAHSTLKCYDSAQTQRPC